MSPTMQTNYARLYRFKMDTHHGRYFAHNIPAGIGAIRTATDADARAVLLALCNDDKVRQRALFYLSQLAPEVLDTAERQGRSAPKSIIGKMKRESGDINPKMSICVHCEGAFDEGNNPRNSCNFHTGELEPTNDIIYHLKDARDPEHFKMGSPLDFVWSCCGKDGMDQGCTRRRHQPDPERNCREVRPYRSYNQYVASSSEDESEAEAEAEAEAESEVESEPEVEERQENRGRVGVQRNVREIIVISSDEEGDD